MEEEARAAPNRIVTTMNIRSCLGALVHAFLATGDGGPESEVSASPEVSVEMQMRYR